MCIRTRTFVGIFSALLSSTVSVNAQDISTETLIKDYEFYNDICRGGSGNEESTWEACGARDYVLYTLNQLGACYGREDEAGYQHQWHSCSSGSLRLAMRPDFQQELPVEAPTAQIRTEQFKDWRLETGPAISDEGEDICRAVTIAQNSGIRLEVGRGEGMTTIVFRETVGNWPDLSGGFSFSLGGYGEFLFRDALIWYTDAALLDALRGQDHAILVDPNGVRHEFSLSGSSAAIGALSICG